MACRMHFVCTFVLQSVAIICYYITKCKHIIVIYGKV